MDAHYSGWRRLVVAILVSAMFPAFARIEDELAHADRILRLRNFGAASKAYLAILDRTPESCEARYGLVRAYLASNQLDHAEGTAVAGAKMDPSSELRRVTMGDVYFRRGRLAEAEREYRTALQLERNLASAWFGLGRVLHSASMRRTAASHIERAHELDPEDPEILLAWSALQPPSIEVAALERYVAAIEPYDATEARSMRGRIAVRKALNGKRPFQLESVYQRRTIRLEPVIGPDGSTRSWAVLVSINASRPLRLVLDTSASGITVGEDIQSGLPKADFVVAQRVRIGGIEWSHCPISITDSGRMLNADGVIGADVFEQFLVTIDSPRSQVILEPYPGQKEPPKNELEDRATPAGWRSFTPVFRFGPALLLPVSGGLFVLNTASSMNLLSNSFARELRSSTLEFAGFRHPVAAMQTADLTPLSESASTEISGMLGFAALSKVRLTLDYRDGLVSFVYNDSSLD
jgi:hypothetical protein